MEHSYIPQPKAVATEIADGDNFAIYEAEGFPGLKWSGKMPLPKIGERIYASMNSLGWAKVEGYYESGGFLGLMLRFENPPDWYERQRQGNVREHEQAKKLGPEKAQTERVRLMPQWILDGLGVCFGAEVRSAETQ